MMWRVVAASAVGNSHTVTVMACQDSCLTQVKTDLAKPLLLTINGLEVPITSMAGKYANMINFVTDENAIDVLAVKALPAQPEKVAVFSDDIQRLALNMATKTAHTPFFTPFFTVLAKATAVQEDHLQAELAQFLESPAVNERTGNDKTLALADSAGSG